MLGRCGILLLKIYGAVLAVAAGGFVGANVVGLAAGAVAFFRDDLNPPYLLRAIHAGWVIGATLFFLSLAWRMRRKKPKKRTRASGVDTSSARDSMEDSRDDTASQLSFIPSMAVGGIVGMLAGAVFGLSIVFLWFSFSYSPFAPADWRPTIFLFRHNVRLTGGRQSLATSHTFPVWALIVCSLFGAAVGGVAGSIRRIRFSWGPDSM